VGGRAGQAPVLTRAQAERLEASERGRRALVSLMSRPAPRRPWRSPAPPRLSDGNGRKEGAR